jgi:DNA invertase Pin-like site-specific DNA recombinase
VNPLPTGDPTIAISYRRVSSTDEVKGFGLAGQQRMNRAFAKRERVRIAADFHEDASGDLRIADRPELAAALDAVREHGAGLLIVADRSRLARGELAAFEAKAMFEAAGATIVYADGQNAGGLADGLGHLLAAEDKRATVAKLKRGREDAAAQHPTARKQGGKVPYGYRRVKHGLVIEPIAAEHVRTIFKLAAAGFGANRIAARMSAQTTTMMPPWTPATISGILRRDLYMRATPGRIVAPKRWWAVQRGLEARRKRAA